MHIATQRQTGRCYGAARNCQHRRDMDKDTRTRFATLTGLEISDDTFCNQQVDTEARNGLTVRVFEISIMFLLLHPQKVQVFLLTDKSKVMRYYLQVQSVAKPLQIYYSIFLAKSQQCF